MQHTVKAMLHQESHWPAGIPFKSWREKKKEKNISVKPVLNQHLKVIPNIPQENKHKNTLLNKNYHIWLRYITTELLQKQTSIL